jgi:hypothetical protein
MKTTLLLCAACLLVLAGCKRTMSVSVGEAVRVPTVTLAADRSGTLDAIAQYTLVAGTSSATRMPDGYEVEVELALGDAQLDGRPVKLSYTKGAMVKVRLSEDKRSTTWPTDMTEPGGPPSLELPITATLTAAEASALKCRTRVPLVIETQWSVVQPAGASWELEEPTKGVATDTIRATVNCEGTPEPPSKQASAQSPGQTDASPAKQPDGGQADGAPAATE